MTIKYNKDYAKGVKPRYYKRQKAIVITSFNDIFKITLKHFKQNYNSVVVSRIGKYYIIKGE